MQPPESVHIAESQLRQLLELQRALLDVLARGGALAPCLDEVCALFEACAPGMVASVMRLTSAGELVFASAASLPAAARRALDGGRPGPHAGSCAHAAWSGKPTFVGDAQSDPRWAAAHGVATECGIRSCWSAPVRNRGCEVVGTFALSSLEMHLPGVFHRQLLELGASVIGLLFDQEGQQVVRVDGESRLRRLALVASQIPSGVVITDARGVIDWVNEGMLQLCGHDSQELIGRRRSELLRGERTDPQVLQALEDALRAGTELSAVLVNYRKDGVPFTVQLTSTPLRDDYGRHEGSVVLEVDVTATGRLSDFNALLAAVTESAASHQDPLTLIQEITELAVRYAGLQLSWIGRPQADGWFEFLSRDGPAVDYVTDLRVSSDPSLAEGNGIGGRCWRESRCFYNRSFAGEAFLRPWQARAARFGIHASAALPIRRGGSMWAVLTVYHAQEDVFDTELRAVLEALASSISRGLDRIDMSRREREAQALNRSMLDSATVGVTLLKDRVIKRANQRAAAILGASDPQQLQGLSVAGMYASVAEGQQIPQRITDAFNSRGRAVFETRFRRLDGVEVWLRIEGAPFEQGGFDQIWSLVDITEQRLAIEGQALLADALGSVQEGVLIADPNGRMVYINQAFEDLTGYSFEEMRGRTCALLQGPETDASTVARIAAALSQDKVFVGDILNYRKNGEAFWNQLVINPLRNASGDVTHYVGVQRDVTDVHRLHARLEHLAFHDDLTNRPNRRELDRHLAEAMERAHDTGTALALAMIDLDDFKAVNDTYGHVAGDRLLRGFTDWIAIGLVPGDFLARVGGDEFVVLFEDLRPEAFAEEVARRAGMLAAATAGSIEIEPGVPIEIAFSMGVAIYPEDTAEGGVLLRMADEALFHVKQHKLERSSWWMLHGAQAESDLHLEQAIETYSDEAARLLQKTGAELEGVCAQFVENFYHRLGEDAYGKEILAGLEATEIEGLKGMQRAHLRLLTSVDLTRERLAVASQRIGYMHALAGIDSSFLLRWMANYRELLSSHFNAHPMAARQRYQVIQLVERRLQDDMQTQLDAQSQTLAQFSDAVFVALPDHGASWNVALNAEISAVGSLPGIACALVLRQSTQGVFNIEAGAGDHSFEVMTLFNSGALGTRPAVALPPDESLLMRAWQTATIQASTSPPMGSDQPRVWGAFANKLGGLGLRAGVYVPVLDSHGVPVALLLLLGRFPNQFCSSAMRQFTRNLQQRWSEIWQRCSRPPPPVSQEQAIAYRERLFSGGLRMFMQPVVDLHNGQLVKVEALARLDLGDGKLVGPDAFLPLLRHAELDGLFQLGLDLALAALMEWEAQGLTINVALNLPPQTLADPACAQWVGQALVRHAVPAKRLTLEVLENQRVDELRRDEGVQRLMDVGVCLAMDDLGSGYSSLRRLASLPFSIIKVDQGLLKRIRMEPAQTISLINTVIQMGRDFECEVVVEGLEDLGMIEVARLLGARFGQGYAIARPMPAQELIPWSRNLQLIDLPRALNTTLGAVAFQWLALRQRSAHAGSLHDCPMTDLISRMDGDTAALTHLHEAVHHDPQDQRAARDLLECLDAMVRSAHSGG